MTAIDKLTDERIDEIINEHGIIEEPLSHSGARYFARAIESEVRALLAGAAEGWQRVPKDPTREMLDAGVAHAIRDKDEDKYRARGQVLAIYLDMLDAAPGAAAPLETTRAQAASQRRPTWDEEIMAAADRYWEASTAARYRVRAELEAVVKRALGTDGVPSVVEAADAGGVPEGQKR